MEKEKKYKKGDILAHQNLTISILDWLLIIITHLKEIREKLELSEKWEIEYLSKNPTDTFTYNS